MAIEAFEGKSPDIHPQAWVSPHAYVSGDTVIGADSSVWPMSVVRGDVNYIRIGERTNIQDGAVLHVTHGGPFTRPDGLPLIVGNDVIVGHSAVLHACTIGNRCLIGMGAIILDGAIIEDDTIIAAGALVPPGKHLASGFLWSGRPVTQSRALSDKELAYFTYSAAYYVELAKRTAASIANNT